MKFVSKAVVAAASALTLTAFSVPADAAVYIGLQQAGVNGGAITTVASGAAFASYTASYGTFELNLVTGAPGSHPVVLDSTANNQNNAGAGGTLDIWVTLTDITGLIPNTFLSSFTSNVLPAGWTVTETTYADGANGLYGGQLLSSHTFNSIGTFVDTAAFAGGGVNGTYSVTQRYTLNATGIGGALSTISVAGVPEPATWALMISGFAGAGVMLRSRRRSMATVA